MTYDLAALPEPIRSKITPYKGHWLWMGTMSNGYGDLGGKGNRYIHRYTYERFIGRVPDGLWVAHKPDPVCGMSNCCYPGCLEAVDVSEASGRSGGGGNRRKTHCPKGHPYSGPNLIERRREGGKTTRECRACRKVRQANRPKPPPLPPDDPRHGRRVAYGYHQCRCEVCTTANMEYVRRWHHNIPVAKP